MAPNSKKGKSKASSQASSKDGGKKEPKTDETVKPEDTKTEQPPKQEEVDKKDVATETDTKSEKTNGDCIDDTLLNTKYPCNSYCNEGEDDAALMYRGIKCAMSQKDKAAIALGDMERCMVAKGLCGEGSAKKPIPGGPIVCVCHAWDCPNRHYVGAKLNNGRLSRCRCSPRCRQMFNVKTLSCTCNREDNFMQPMPPHPNKRTIPDFIDSLIEKRYIGFKNEETVFTTFGHIFCVTQAFALDNDKNESSSVSWMDTASGCKAHGIRHADVLGEMKMHDPKCSWFKTIVEAWERLQNPCGPLWICKDMPKCPEQSAYDNMSNEEAVVRRRMFCDCSNCFYPMNIVN